jgi:hypothetical protein
MGSEKTKRIKRIVDEVCDRLEHIRICDEEQRQNIALIVLRSDPSNDRGATIAAEAAVRNPSIKAESFGPFGPSGTGNEPITSKIKPTMMAPFDYVSRVDAIVRIANDMNLRLEFESTTYTNQYRAMLFSSVVTFRVPRGPRAGMTVQQCMDLERDSVTRERHEEELIKCLDEIAEASGYLIVEGAGEDPEYGSFMRITLDLANWCEQLYIMTGR